MERLISLTPAAAPHFAHLRGAAGSEWFCSHDPIDRKLGSGGGTLHLLREAWEASGTSETLCQWMGARRGLILHAGGQSRRLPAYAAEGKALLPVPVFRWSRGQRLDQTLLDLQQPFLEELLEAAPGSGKWLIASGDVLLEADQLPGQLPDVDVLCVGMWGEADQATRHGVFFAPRTDPGKLAFVRQKPALDELRACARGHYFLLDVGVWILSARALALLAGRCGLSEDGTGRPGTYDLYGDFGPALGDEPSVVDREIHALSTALLPLEDGRFYHFGSGPDLIESNLRLQNRVIDQRRLSSVGIKPHPSLFVQNSHVGKGVLGEQNQSIWIENACIPAGWKLQGRHVLTGIPDNADALRVPEGVCLEYMPLCDGGYALRLYGFSDTFRGPVGDGQTCYCGESLNRWLEQRNLSVEKLGWDPQTDLQEAPLFPVVSEWPEAGFVQWLLDGKGDWEQYQKMYTESRRLSASEIAAQADVRAFHLVRRQRMAASLPELARHARRSVFYQLDLEDLADKFHQSGRELPPGRPDPEENLYRHLHDSMLRSRIRRLRGEEDWETEERRAFASLRQAMIRDAMAEPVRPVVDCLEDQILWGRSPVRLDLAGGWTDTPPYCFLHGGHVINLAVELNGQPPIQVFARRRQEPAIRIRSIDLGSSQELRDFEDIRSYAEVGSGFAIPKAALALAGFLPEFHPEGGPGSLGEQLASMGGGLELSLLCAVPKGSGLGTSSILAATLLGVLNEVCQLGWDGFGVARRVLVLEQMLTSGGGWQDQYGGLLRGVKSLQTRPGLDQTPRIRWLDDYLFTDPAVRVNSLLYYTGITRVAKSVLGEIVRSMFLNSGRRLEVLRRIGENAAALEESLQEGDYAALGRSVRRSWQLNQELDSGTNPPEIARLLAPLEDWLAGAKLLGAGGGGYLLLLAKDATASQRIKEYLQANPPNARARFVRMAVSPDGFQVTRS